MRISLIKCIDWSYITKNYNIIKIKKIHINFYKNIKQTNRKLLFSHQSPTITNNTLN